MIATHAEAEVGRFQKARELGIVKIVGTDSCRRKSANHAETSRSFLVGGRCACNKVGWCLMCGACASQRRVESLCVQLCSCAAGR